MGTTGTTGSLAFTGISTFSNDFQSILQREVAIAQLPVKAPQNRQADLLGKKQALIALNPIVANLASAVASLGSIAAGQGLTASSSDSNTVSVVNTGASSPASYKLSNITVATVASETSLAGYVDSTMAPVWVAGQNKFDLVVGSSTYHLDVTGQDNLTGLVNAIDNSGAPVTASIINSGSASYLSLNTNDVGQTTLTLSGIPQAASLISNTGTGTESSMAGYPDTGATAVSNSGRVDLTVGALNGAIQVNQSSNVFKNVVPGLSFTLNQNNAGSVNLNVAVGSSQLTNALQTFAEHYNALVDQVTQQTGTGAGAMGGDSIIRNISDDLRQLSSYTVSNGSSVNSLYGLGITFADNSGPYVRLATQAGNSALPW